MLPLVTLAILALAVSLDGFGVGVMYGVRKIRIPLISIAIISFCSGVVIFASMFIGVLLLQFISVETAKIIGATILIAIGIWAIIQMIIHRNYDSREPSSISDKKLVHIEFKKVGLVIEILKTPSKADVDRSGNISASEAAFLGIALSLDAFGAGIGAALVGFSPVMTSLVIAAASGVFITLGLRVGYMISNIAWVKKCSLLPGVILIVMGIIKLF